MSPLIEAKDLSFAYEPGGKPVLKRVSMDVNSGETLLLLGPGGCGKSSLLFCLNRLFPEAVDGWLDGRILLGGVDVANLPPGEVNRRIGTVFQDPESQFCMRTVEEELAFGLENRCIPREDMDLRINLALAEAGLAAWRKESIHRLSGGMKQKLAIACALSLEQDILLLDEPTANLDPYSRRELVDYLARLKQSRSLTLVVVEHQLDGWIELADRCMVMNESGQVAFAGKPQQCFESEYESLQQMGIAIPACFRKVAAAERKTGRGPNLPGQAPAVLRLNNVGLTLGNKSVLKNIDLSIYPGELLAIAGPNGSGKTSLAQLMAGLGDKESTKRIQLFQRGLAQWTEPELRRKIGYVFQNPEHQFVTDTVFDEVAFGKRMNGTDPSRLKQKVLHVLELANLREEAERNPFDLSQGQKRRLSVAAMLIEDQPVLILDEPTFGQDALASQWLMELLNKRAAEGKTVVMVTHEMELVQQYADRVLVLIDGEIRYLGAPDKLWGCEDLLAQARLLPPASWGRQNKGEAVGHAT
jgi:energy-coupling factor transport system ATP-binding protein